MSLNQPGKKSLPPQQIWVTWLRPQLRSWHGGRAGRVPASLDSSMVVTLRPRTRPILAVLTPAKASIIHRHRVGKGAMFLPRPCWKMACIGRDRHCRKIRGQTLGFSAAIAKPRALLTETRQRHPPVRQFPALPFSLTRHHRGLQPSREVPRHSSNLREFHSTCRDWLLQPHLDHRPSGTRRTHVSSTRSSVNQQNSGRGN